MMRRKIPAEKKISEFPKPYKSNATPYTRNSFSRSTVDMSRMSPIPSSHRISKTIFLGDAQVGKTSLINRYSHEVFYRSYKTTIGVDFEIEKFDILGTPFNLQIWDTAGQERFRSIASSYYRGADIIAVVFDLSSVNTLYTVSQWLKDALKVSAKRPLLFLIGTKLDMISNSVFQDIEKLAIKTAEKLEAEFWAVSSRTGENVDEMFRRMAALMFDRQMMNQKKPEHQTVSTDGFTYHTCQKSVDKDLWLTYWQVDTACRALMHATREYTFDQKQTANELRNMVEQLDSKNWRVIVDDPGKVLKSEENGGYCISNIEETPTTTCKKIKNKSTKYWSTETPNVEGSRNCIELLIMIVGTHLIQKMLKDNKTDPKRVWEIVAKNLNDCGYSVPGKTLAKQGVEVHEKWKYITMTYLEFQNNERQKQDRPSYFDMLDKVLGGKQDDSKSLSESESQDSSIKKLPDACEDRVDVEKSNCSVSPSLLLQIMEELSDYESNFTLPPKPTKENITNYWMTETPNVEGCKNCTELLITFVGEDLIQELINEKSLSHKKVWQYIAKLMADRGYPVPGHSFEDQGERVYQKWKNIGRTYLKFKDLSTLTQSANRGPPNYFDVLDKVVQKLQQADNTKLLLNSFSILNPGPKDSHNIDNQLNRQDSTEEETSRIDSGHGKPRKEDIINYWATKTTDVQSCNDCTELLISFIGEESIQEMFNDKKFSEKKVWQFLAKIMADHGYSVPGQTAEEQGEQIYQKWKNMGIMYSKYKDHASQVEPSYKDPPSCFSALDKVVQQLQKSHNGTCLLDSFILANSKKASSPLLEDGNDIDYPHHISEGTTDVDNSMNEIAPSIRKKRKSETINYWLTDTPDIERSNNCTELLIKIVGGDTIQKLLTNKITSKKKVWQIVAKELCALGYKVPAPTIEEQGEKVNQKWKNIVASYAKFKVKLNQTGQTHKDPPLFFQALDKVLGKNDTFCSKLLLDSFSNNSLVQKKSTATEEISLTPFKPQLPNQQPEPTVELSINPQTNQPLMKDEPISYWYADTPNIEGCRNCGELLIWIVGEESIQKMLRENLIPKKKVWQKVAKIMNDYGYKVPGMLLGQQGERVRQKWINMMKVYVKHKNYIKQTGDVSKERPGYFDLINKVMMKNVPKLKNVSDIICPEKSAMMKKFQQLYPGSSRNNTQYNSYWLTETRNLEGIRNITELLIITVEESKIHKMLHNKRNAKRIDWRYVVNKIEKCGYKIPGNTAAKKGDKVRHKWNSMKKVYWKYRHYEDRTGHPRKFVPYYYDAMHKILDNQQVVSPKIISPVHSPLTVSLEPEQNSDGENTNTSTPKIPLQINKCNATGADTIQAVGTPKDQDEIHSYWLTETPNIEGVQNRSELLIRIVGEKSIQKVLNNKKYSKIKVWQQVAFKMAKLGHIVPGMTLAEQGIRVCQKWENITESWKDPSYCDMTTDEVLGEENVDYSTLLFGSVPSPKSSQRHDIWSHSDDSPRSSTSPDVSMQIEQDALENGGLITNEIEMGEDEEISKVFQTPKSTMCLQTKTQEEYYKELKNKIFQECTQERKAQQQNHDEITKLLKRQNQQRDNMLSILRQLSKSPEV